MSAQPVDVLAVLDKAKHLVLLHDPLVRKRLRPESNSPGAQAFGFVETLGEARAAVAELIGAALVVVKLDPASPEKDSLQNAIARVQGSAP